MSNDRHNQNSLDLQSSVKPSLNLTAKGWFDRRSKEDPFPSSYAMTVISL